MSAVASWSYSNKATLWSRVARDDWSSVASFGAPQEIDCDYIAEAKRMVDSKGVEFVSGQILYTERADIEPGDMVLIGEHSQADPVVAGAAEVRSVKRYADTFDRAADDFQVVT